MKLIRAIRAVGYPLLRALGDLQAVLLAGKKGSGGPLAKRAGRRIVGRASGKIIGRLFR